MSLEPLALGALRFEGSQETPKETTLRTNGSLE
jgi:hypothetical protein